MNLKMFLKTIRSTEWGERRDTKRRIVSSCAIGKRRRCKRLGWDFGEHCCQVQSRAVETESSFGFLTGDC